MELSLGEPGATYGSVTGLSGRRKRPRQVPGRQPVAGQVTGNCFGVDRKLRVGAQRQPVCGVQARTLTRE